MSQEYKILSFSASTNGGITDTTSEYVSTSAATLSFDSITATTFFGDGSNLSGITGESNTGLNVGNGAEIFRDKTGTTLNFRTIESTTENRVSAQLSGDTIQLDVNETNFVLWPLVVNGNKLISGGATYLSGLTFNVSALVYIIGDTIYNASASTVTLLSGDTNFDRIDVIYADVSGNTGSVQGVASASPSKPSLDSATQVEVTFVTVPAGSTAPDVEITKVYDEKTGIGGGEWDYSATTAVRISGDSTNTAYSGTKSIRFINAVAGDQFAMDNPTPYDTSSDNTISFYIKNAVAWSGVKEFIEISMRNANDTINGNTVRVDHGKYGFDATNTTSWQVVSIALGDFAMSTNLVSKVRFRVNKDSGAASSLNLNIDLIRFQAGAPTTSPQNIWLSFVTDDNVVAVATSSTDQMRLSGGTNITTSMNGKNAIFNLDSNISLTSVNATSITATTYYGDGSNLSGISSTDTYVTGGTYSNGTATYTNNTGGTFNVAGFFTGFTLSDGANTQSIGNGDTFLVSAGSGLTSTVSATDRVTLNLNITGTTAEASPTTGDKLLLYDATSGEHRNIDWSQLPGSGGGEANTASNVGGANGIFYQKSGVDLQFRSLSAGTNVTITSGETTLTISASGSGSGSSRITGSTTTTNATPTVVDSIDTLSDNSTNLVVVYVKAYQSGGSQWGIWKRTLTVTKVSGAVTIREENADVDKQSSGLKSYSLSFTVNSGNIDIYVTGIAATTIDWKSAYEIIL